MLFRSLNDSVLRVTARRARVFLRRNSEEQHALDAEREELACLAHQAVKLEARDARHRIDRTRVTRALHHEKRLYELFEVDAMLAYERAHDLAAAKAPRTQENQRPTPVGVAFDACCKRSASSVPSASACASVEIARSIRARTNDPGAAQKAPSTIIPRAPKLAWTPNGALHPARMARSAARSQVMQSSLSASLTASRKMLASCS